MKQRRQWGVVLRREASRTSKRRQLYLLRAAAGFVVGGLMLMVLLATNVEAPQDYARLGGNLFNAYAIILLLGAGGVAPVVMAQAMLEERESGTLEIICLSNLRPMDLLTGKLGTSVGFLLLTALGTLPIGLLSITLGGVAPSQAVSLGAAVVGLALASGAVATAVALISRSLAIPVLATFVWVALVPMTVPIMSVRAIKRLTAGGQEIDILAVQSGIWAPFAGSWVGLAGSIPPLVMALTSLWIAAALFKRGTLRGFDSLRSPRTLRYGWPALAVYLIVYWRLMYNVSVQSDAWPVGAHPWVPAASVAAAWAAQLALSLLLLQCTLWLVPLLNRTRVHRWPTFLPDLPVLQRELFTGAHGPLGKFLLVLVALWLVATLAGAWTSDAREVFFAGAFIGMLGTTLTSSLIITSSIAGERQRDTLSLLCLTTMNKSTLVRQQFIGALIRAALPAILCLGMAVVASRGQLLGLRYNAIESMTFVHHPIPRLLAIVCWALGAWSTITLTQALIAVRVRNVNSVWAINTLLGSLGPIAILYMGVYLGERRTLGSGLKFVGYVIFPLQKDWSNHGVSVSTLVSILAWSALAGTLWWLTVRAFERHGHRR